MISKLPSWSLEGRVDAEALQERFGARPGLITDIDSNGRWQVHAIGVAVETAIIAYDGRRVRITIEEI